MTNSKSNFQKTYMAVFAFVFVYLVWDLSVRFTSVSLVFPYPAEVFKYFFKSITEPIGKYTLYGHTYFSLKRVLIGFGLSSVSGVILGVAMGYSKTINAIVKPIFNIIRPIPGLAWIPLAILWLGIGENAKYFIIFMGGFANVVLNSYDGTNNVNKTLIGAAELLGANKAQIFFHVILPSAVPYIFAGLQVSLSTSWMAVLAAEMVSSYEGAGWIINMGMNTANTVQILTGMVAIGIVGFVLASIMRFAERRLCSWSIRGK